MPFGTFKESTQKMWGNFKDEAIKTFTDPVKVGAIVVNAASSAAISYGVEKFLLKGIEWKYKWIGHKMAKIPVINVKVPYPAMVDKKLVLVPKMAGKPINELKRNLVAGATGTIISGFWTVPVYLKVDKEIGKAMAIGSGINMLGWIIKGGIQYAKASMDYKAKSSKKPVGKKTAKATRATSMIPPMDKSYSDYTFYAGASKNYRPLTPASPFPASSTRNPYDVAWEQYAQPEDSPGMQQDAYVWPPNQRPYEGQVPYYDEPMYVDPIDYQPMQGDEAGDLEGDVEGDVEGDEVGKHYGGGGRGRGWGTGPGWGPYYPEPIYVETEVPEEAPPQPQVIIVKEQPWWASGIGEQGQDWLSHGDTDGEGVEGDSDGIITYRGAKKPKKKKEKKEKKGKRDEDADVEKIDEEDSEMLDTEGIAAVYNW